MSTFDQTGSIAPVEPLKMLNADGTPYERPAHVQTELGRILALSHSERAAEAPGVHSETLVYLIRHRKQADEELYEVVFQELSKRIVRTARRHVRGFPKIAIEEIVSKVEIQILELLVANSLDPAGDFFEVGFAQGVEGRTRNARRGYQRSLTGGRRGWVVTDETDDGDEIERTIELVEDNAAGPEDIVLAMKDEERRRELFGRARAVVERSAVPRGCNAFLLRKLADPIERSKQRQPGTPLWSDRLSDPALDQRGCESHARAITD